VASPGRTSQAAGASFSTPVLAVIVAVSTNRFAAWDIYLIVAIVILGLAVVAAILMLA
jgi:energy-converting hydrogenase Eha subunit A